MSVSVVSTSRMEEIAIRCQAMLTPNFADRVSDTFPPSFCRIFRGPARGRQTPVTWPARSFAYRLWSHLLVMQSRRQRGRMIAVSTVTIARPLLRIDVTTLSALCGHFSLVYHDVGAIRGERTHKYFKCIPPKTMSCCTYNAIVTSLVGRNLLRWLLR